MGKRGKGTHLLCRNVPIRGLLSILLLAVLLAGFRHPLPAAGMTPAIKEVYPSSREKARLEIKPAGEPGRVVIVSLDYLQVRDLEENLPPNLARLASGGAVALMNVNTGGGITPENTHASIGSGSHMVACEASSRGFREDDKVAWGTAADEYRRRTGRLPPAGSLVYLDIAGINLTNKKFHYTVVPGALGMKLHEAGCRTAALGNSDTDGSPGRHIISMVMDHRGIVDTGSVGRDATRPEKVFPGGFSTDYDVLMDRFTRLPPDVRLVAIDLGDLARLQDVREHTDLENWRCWRNEALRRADDFLGKLAGRMNAGRDLLMVICPTPGDDGLKKDKMALVLLYGGGVGGGLLTTPTTRRPGVIMNIDIAPTVLNYLGIPAPEFFAGRPAQVIPGAVGISKLNGMYRVLEMTYEARPFLQKGYVIFQLILLAVSLGFIFRKKTGKEFLKPFLLAVMAVPLAYLVMPLLPAGGIPAMVGELISVTALITLFTILLHKKCGIDPFLLICLATAAAIAADLAAGSPLQKASILGYDPIVGARFYGLGNEYMGVLIGSVLVGTAALIQSAEKRRKLLISAAGAAYLTVLYLIAAPHLGTNAGGTIAAASAFLVTYVLFRGGRLAWPLAFSVAAAVGLVMLALILYDLSRPAQYQSHIGRAAALITVGGLNEIAGIISRKSEMNIKLIRYTIWSRVFLASLGILALLFYRPVGVMEGIKNRYPYLFKGLVGVITGSVTAFIFNDSGVVAAATVMVFGAPPLVYLVLDEIEG